MISFLGFLIMLLGFANLAHVVDVHPSLWVSLALIISGCGIWCTRAKRLW